MEVALSPTFIFVKPICMGELGIESSQSKRGHPLKGTLSKNNTPLKGEVISFAMDQICHEIP
jgi:hypothetical protein